MAGPKSIFDMLRETNRKGSVIRLKGGGYSGVPAGPDPTPTNTTTPSVTPTNTTTPSVTPTNTITPSVTPTSTVTSTVTPTSTVVPTSTPTLTPTPTPTLTPTPTFTLTPTPTTTSGGTPTPTPSSSLTPTPTTSTALSGSTPTPTPTSTLTPTPTPTTINPLVFNVTSPFGGIYIVNGQNNPVLNLITGNHYTFNINAPSHPFYIQTSAGSYNAGNVYNTGVTNNGTGNGTLTFSVSAGAPSTLYYVCSIHGGMGNQINIT